MGPYLTLKGAFIIGMIMTSSTYGNCGLSMIIVGDTQPGTHTSGNLDGFVVGSVGQRFRRHRLYRRLDAGAG